jgi:hypothetical protein
MTSQVFVSDWRDNGDFVRRLVDDLTSRGVDIWLDVRDILASERWDSEVQAALRESDYFGDVIPIPDTELTISDLAKRQYPRCGPNVFP